MAALFFVWALGGGLGCSLLLPFDDECRTDEECASRGAGLRCVARLCVRDDTRAADEVAGADSDAVAAPDVPVDVPTVADAGDTSGPADAADVAPRPDGGDAADVPAQPDAGTHVPPGELITANCTRFYGHGVTLDQAFDEDVLLIGAILPFSGQLGILGPFLDQAIEMAVKEINQVGGLRGRRFAVLSCDDATSGETSLAVATHLVEKARVPVIIGPVSSEITLNVFSRVTGPAGVLLVSPAASSPVMDNVPTDGLVWRTAPSNALLSAAIAEHVAALGEDRVAAVNRDDTWGNAMREVFDARYCAARDCSAGRYLSRSYTTTNFEVSQSEILAELVAFQPDVVVLNAYISDGAAFLIGATAAGIDRIITPDGLRDSIAFALVPPAENARVLCDLFGVSAEPPTAAFRIRYETLWRQAPVPYTANAYDAVYVVGYAIAAASRDGGPTPTGRQIAAAIPRLSSGTPIPTGNGDWNRGVQILRTGDSATIDYQGASGDVNLDPATGAVAGDVEGWHFNLTSLAPESLGIVYTWDGDYTPPDYGLATPDPTCAALP
jgi:branched-chain amino acid transport system substrate-binding protein